MVIRLVLPEGLTRSAQKPVRFARRKSFERLQKAAWLNSRCSQEMNMIRHDDKGVEFIVVQIFVASLDRLHDWARDFRLSEVGGAPIGRHPGSDRSTRTPYRNSAYRVGDSEHEEDCRADATSEKSGLPSGCTWGKRRLYCFTFQLANPNRLPAAVCVFCRARVSFVRILLSTTSVACHGAYHGHGQGVPGAGWRRRRVLVRRGVR